jgi:hypothetical protein
MRTDDLDWRLRQALAETGSAWQPSGRSAADMVDRVRRRSVRRKRNIAMGACALAVVLVVGVGVHSTTSRTSNREASSAGAPSSIASTEPRPPAAAGIAVPPAPVHPRNRLDQPQGTVACAASVTVGSGPSRCAGLVTASPSSGSGFSTSNSAAGTPEETNAQSIPVSITAPLGRHVSVDMPLAPLGAWNAPISVTAPGVPATLRHELGLDPAVHLGAIRVIASTRGVGTRSASTVFAGVKPGVVVLSATLKGACLPSTNAHASTGPPSCAAIRTRWTLVVFITSQ